MDMVLSGTGDANQKRSSPYTLDINYDKSGLVLTENFLRDSKQPIWKQTNTFIFKVEFL